MLCTKVAQALQKSPGGHYEAHITYHGLQNEGGDLTGIGGDEGLDSRQVVVGRSEGILSHAHGYAGRIGLAGGEGSATSGNQKSIAVAVVTAFKLDNFGAACVAPRRPHGRHAGFGARIYEADFFDAGHHGPNQLGHLDFAVGRRTKAERVGQRLGHGIEYTVRGVTENHRTPGVDKIDVTVAIHVGEPSAMGTLHKHRRAAHRPESPHWRVYAARNKGFGTFEKSSRSG